jgi:hypothetical protein
MMLVDMVVYNKKENWAMLVKSLLERLGFADVWLNQGIRNDTWFLMHLNQRCIFAALEEETMGIIGS